MLHSVAGLNQRLNDERARPPSGTDEQQHQMRGHAICFWIGMKHALGLLSAISLSLTLPACSPGAAKADNPLAGPYRVVTLADIFADAPKPKPDGDLKTFLRDRLDWAYAPGRLPLAVTDPEADLRLQQTITPEQVQAVERELAKEGHRGAQMLMAMDGGGEVHPSVNELAIAGFEPAQIFAGGIQATMGDSPEARANREKIGKLKDRYPMAKMVLGLALTDQTDPKEKAEGIRLLSELHELDPLLLQTVVTTFYFMQPTNPDADKTARQMLEAYMATYAIHVKAGEPVMQGAPVALASMLENGRGGPKDLARATQIYTDTVRQSHLTCEPEAVDALKRLNKPIPEGTGPACQQQKPANPLEQ